MSTAGGRTGVVPTIETSTPAIGTMLPSITPSQVLRQFSLNTLPWMRPGFGHS